MGKLITISGIDGVGKETQTKLTAEYFRAKGYKVATISFPRYNITKSSKLIRHYLSGEFGDIFDVDPYFSGMLYALDRKESKESLELLLNTNDIVICDRYVLDGILYGLAKLPLYKIEAVNYSNWQHDLEYYNFKIPKPNLQLFLHIPVNLSQKLIENRNKLSNNLTIDIHEKNLIYQSKVLEVLKNSFGRQIKIKIINCFDLNNDDIYNKSYITNLITNTIEEYFGRCYH